MTLPGSTGVSFWLEYTVTLITVEVLVIGAVVAMLKEAPGAEITWV